MTPVLADEVDRRSERILDDGDDLSTRLPVGDGHTSHDLGGHETQADCHDEQRKSLHVVHTGTNEQKA